MQTRGLGQEAAAGRVKARRSWPVLLRELQLAEAAQKAALAALTSAERRFLALPTRERKPLPAWYRAAHETAAKVCEDLEALHRRLAATPAAGRQGMRAKARLLAEIHGVAPKTPVRVGDRDDLVACLIRSLIADLAGNPRRGA